MKAQSAIEYLVTYGWMIVVVGIAGGAVTQVIAPECPLEVRGIEVGELQVEDTGLTTDSRMAFVMQSDTSEQITVTQVNINNMDTGADNISRQVGLQLDPGENEPLDVAEIQPEEGECTRADVQIMYDYGPLAGQTVSGQLTAPTAFIEAIEENLKTRGGQIVSLDIGASITPESEDICIGSNCPGELDDELQTEHERYVNRSGDTMRGPLEVGDLNAQCIGDSCTEHGEQELEGFVTTENNTMDGTLELETIRPAEDILCTGSNC